MVVNGSAAGLAEAAGRVWTFAGRQFDESRLELRINGKPVELELKPLEVLVQLLQRAGEVVTKDELLDAVWPGLSVVDGSLATAVHKLRKALGDENSAVITTVPRVGYRLTADARSNPSRALPAEQLSFKAGQPVPGRGHWRLVRPLDASANSQVWLAEHPKTRELRVFKFISGTACLKSLKREVTVFRFLRESLGERPDFVRIFEWNFDTPPYFLESEYGGPNLSAWAEDEGGLAGIPVEKRLAMVAGIAETVAAAHGAGVLHKDLKPANVLVTPAAEGGGLIKLADFGSASLVEPSRLKALGITSLGLTQTGLPQSPSLTGTLMYLAPEVLSGNSPTALADVYALGVILYQAVIGDFRKPLAEGWKDEIGDPLIREDIAACVCGDPARRLASAAELAQRLRGLEQRRIERSRIEQAWQREQIATRKRADSRIRRPWVALASMAVLALVLAVAVLFYVHRVPKLTEKDTIVLADFTNTTGDAAFDDTLKTALSVSVFQSPFLNVLSDSDVAKTLQQMTRPVGTKLTPEVTRELCQRAGSKAYISASIGSLGSQYVLGLKAVNCQNGDLLAQEQVTAAAKERVLDTLGEAVSKLRGELGESLATVQKFDVPLAEATTSSLEALKAYSLGDKAYREKGPAAALPNHQRAIQLDPNFAKAYREVGSDYFSLGELGRASEYSTKAFQLRQHASEREKLAITADYYQNVTGELDKAAQTYQQEIESYPRDYRAHHDLGNVYNAQGQYEKSGNAFRQSLRLAPDTAAYAYPDLANSLLALQRFDEARQTIRQAQARKLDNFILHNALYALAFLKADTPAMAAEQQWFAGKPEENLGLSLASDTEAYAGHLGKARELTKRAMDSAIRADSRETGATWQENAAMREAAFGNAAEAKQAAAQGLRLARTSRGVEVEAALALSMAGDTARGDSLAQDLSKRFPLDTQMQSLWLPAIQSQLALDRKNPVVALNGPRAADSIELGQIDFVTNLSCLYPKYVRGEAYLEAGQGNAAAAEFQQILDHSGIVWNCWTGALAHLGLARANALQARTSQGADADAAHARSLAAYKDFLTLWKDADPDIPILKEAKAEYAKLQ
jgi:DNA-binding winged helix-turn-helix (wHTH) protein/serine/threonine protein kinase/tetratricopeptide (TPR) repeat protein